MTTSRLPAVESRNGGSDDALAQRRIHAAGLERLVETSEREEERLRGGESVMPEVEPGRLRGELSASKEECGHLRSLLAERGHEIEILRPALAEFGKKETRLRRQLAERSAEIDRLRSELANHEIRVTMQPHQPTSSFLLDRLRRIAATRLPRFLASAYQRRLVRAAGLFDAAWYLERNPDVAASGMDPVRHYFCLGAQQGRDPHPNFGTAWYLENYPDIAARGINPLLHYVLYGAQEGRLIRRPLGENSHLNPDASRPAARYHVSELNLLAGKVAPAPARRPVICVTHVTPWPRRAGNEYRIGRMLDWLVAEGYPVVVVLAPLAGDASVSATYPAVVARYGNVVMCRPDGRVEANFSSLKGSLLALDEQAVASPGTDEPGAQEPSSDTLAQLESSFCGNALVGVLLELERTFAPVTWHVNYIFMTRFLKFTKSGSLSFVDTIDAFSSKHEKVVRYGINDSLSISPEEEARLLRRASAVVAIQGREAAMFKEMLPGMPVITAGVDFDFDTVPSCRTASPMVLYVASDNLLNAKGLHDFLRFAWPFITREVRDVRLVIAGRVGRFVELADPRIEVRGVVDDLGPLYRAARVTVNPSIAGTGLKIKTMEALIHFCPIVSWPNGVEGLPDVLHHLCAVSEDWFDFARKTVALLQGSPHLTTEEERLLLSRVCAADVVYSDLAAWLAQTADGHRGGGSTDHGG